MFENLSSHLDNLTKYFNNLEKMRLLSDSNKKYKNYIKIKSMEKEKNRIPSEKNQIFKKIVYSFSLDNYLRKSMQCPDWEYYCHTENYNNEYINK
ncbi:hypothetical protein H8356DRAFT_1713945 [Neocallimastix lanati (nom. inval.)]|nr:hypothetical protein H8356DRAFT_1713945 [Neocallimastix sp. JGI-2020a]